ncbi:MAG: DUF5665 domain-containing protein [Paracoccaceae bacterium]|nr:DUF5665 domain-containing protein [Paracoccaceae bacterium]
MDGLEREVASLARELEKINNHKVMRAHSSNARLMWFNFLRGLTFGLGSVVGATFLVSMLVYTLSWVDFIPVVGEWAKEVIRVIEEG